MTKQTISFGQLLSSLRADLKITVQKLADEAGVPSTLISALQTGCRQVGENNATKIGRALGLEGEKLQDFVYLALNEASRKVLVEHQAYPAEVLNLVASQLKASGIQPHDVRECILPSGSRSSTSAVIHLNDGRSGQVQVTFN